MSSSERYCIIGAGPSGLVQARAFQHRGIGFDLLDRHSAVGGLWDPANPGTAVYDSVHFVSSKTLSAFSGFPMPEAYPDYPKGHQILDYLRGFSERYDLGQYLRPGQCVTSVIPDADGVDVEVNGKVRRYRGVVCASGVNWSPRMPSFKGEFAGVLRHSSSYRNAAELAGKRVLIVGLGNSAADIACDAIRAAKEVTVSTRRGYHFIPKYVLGQPADVFAASGPQLPKWLELPLFSVLLRLLVGDTASVGMPKPNHRVLESHPLMNDQFLHHLRHGDATLRGGVRQLEAGGVRFLDGSFLEVDEIICATGFKRAIPYVGSEFLEHEGEGLSHFLTVFNRRYPRLATLGFCELNGALYPHIDRLAALVAEAALAQEADAEAFQRFRKLVNSWSPDLRGGLRTIESARHDFYCDDHALKSATLKVFKKMNWKPPSDADFASS